MMFKSAQDLRTAADMRSLQRVAAPWRQARTSWFDGTPESIEARLAATERVLSHARSGFTPAHLELTREAAAARDELLAAKHRLLTDFLDDGARAFKGSRRVVAGSRYFNDEGEPLMDGASARFEDYLDSHPDHYDNHYDDDFGPEPDHDDEDEGTINDYHDDKEWMDFRASRTAGEYDEGIDNLSRYLGDRLLNPQQYVRTYRDEDGPGLPGGLPMELRKHLKHPDPVQGAYNAGYDASGGTGQHAQYLDHEDPLDAASTDWYRAGGQHGDAFHDGWLDYASEIPHRYNNAAEHAGHPEGYFKGAGLHTASRHTAGTSKYAPGGKLDRQRQAEEQAAMHGKIDSAYTDWRDRQHPDDSSRYNRFDDVFDSFHDDAVGTDYYDDLFGTEDSRKAVYDYMRNKYRVSRRTAGTSTPSVGEGGASFSEIGPSLQAGSASVSVPGAIGKAMWNGSTMTGQESTPAFNPGPKATTAGYVADFDDQLLFGSE